MALSPATLWRAWTFEPVVLGGLGVAAAWYAWGVRSLWRAAGRGRGIGDTQVWAFCGGLLTLVVALVSPLDAMGDALFSAHMMQHLLLILVAAPLLVLAEPVLPLLWALPPAIRRRGARWWSRAKAVPALARVLNRPDVTWAAHVAALLFWHLPAPYGWASRHAAVHAIEHASLLGTALLFWWVALAPMGRRQLSYGMSILYISTAGMVMGALGAVLTFANSPWFIAHRTTTASWHLTPLEDQQLAGVIMWVPASLVYLLAAAVLFVKWLAPEAPRPEDPRRPDHAVAAEHRSERHRGHARLSRNRNTAGPAMRLLGTALVGCLLAIGCGRGNGGSTAGGNTGGGEPYRQVAGGDSDRGKIAIRQFGCGACHLIPGVADARGMVGPPLLSFARRVFIAGEVPNTTAFLIRWIQSPESIAPQTAMPNLAVTERQARDIAAYLYTLR